MSALRVGRNGAKTGPVPMTRRQTEDLVRQHLYGARR